MAVSVVSETCTLGETAIYPVPLAPTAPAELPLDPKPADPNVIELKPIEPKPSEDARRLFGLEQLEVSWEGESGTLWTFMRPSGRPSYNSDFLEDFHAWQRGIVAHFADRRAELRYLVL